MFATLKIAFPLTNETTAKTGIGPVMRDTGEFYEKGYSFNRGGGAAFAGNLEGSVDGEIWETVVSLASSAQGTIDSYLNLFRINISSGGALDNSIVRVAGKGR